MTSTDHEAEVQRLMGLARACEVAHYLSCENENSCDDAAYLAAVAALESALREALPQWRPIDEAPKDGTPLIGCTWIPTLPHLYAPVRIYWAAYHPNATGKECWRDAPTCGNKMERLTHFMPLIPAPQQKDSHA